MPEETFAGRYRRIGPLGKGAMASVWLAEDAELGRRVAIKLLRPDADRERFRREARAVAALAHPNVCRLYDFGEADGGPFMVLEYLSGGSLDDRLRAGEPLPDDETERIAAEVAAGLAHAHANGLVHRDLKPSNILFDGEGRAKIADFGIVRMTETGAITETGTVLGTAQYISPEQTTGESSSPASDVYSFGVILFQMLTGRLPFESNSVIDLVRRHRAEPPPPVSALRADAPPGLAALALAALSKDPMDRPADGAALAAALASAPEDAAVTAVLQRPYAEAAPTAVVARPGPPRRSPRGALIAAAIVLLLLGAGVGVALVATRDDSGGVPTVPTTGPSTATTAPASTTAESTTAPTTSAQTTSTTEPTTTTEESTTEPTTTRRTTEPTTTAPTTLPATTVPATTIPATTEPPPTTEPATTVPTTTDVTTTAATVQP